VPDGELVGELGALTTMPDPDGLPLWMTPEGYLVTEPGRAPRARAPAAAVLRWALAPLTWARGPGGLGQRALASTRRAAHGLAGFPRSSSAPSGPPVGYLHRRAGPGRVPLFDAIHPITGDQLLSTHRWEAVDLGYGEPVLIGYIGAEAPVTGTLGTSRPWLPWASRFGQTVR
jgi:hypothetical protein